MWNLAGLNPFSSPLTLDPSLVAFLKSRRCAKEQPTKMTKEEQQPEGASTAVTEEEPRKEDGLQPSTPGWEEASSAGEQKQREGLRY